ncbi:MAG TPA: YihY/virulence factor BrkB family protein [Streptosporangiaceae bacterium]|nr:YihY/virulence factor BrkB family protein [Streptosporangiaceae bacterium]
MNPVERAVRRVDGFQQRHTPAAFAFGIAKKYGDDNGGVLTSNLAYSAFVSLFPLLLVLATILGIVASVNPTFRADALNAVAGQVPLIGHELTGNVHQLRRSSIIGLIVGLIALIWGSTQLAQAGIFTMEQVWNLPGPARPGYVQRLGRAALFLGLLGGGVIATTLLVVVNSYAHNALALVVVYYLLAAAVNSGMYVGGFRVLTPKGVPTRSLLTGAVTGGIGWTLLQLLGTFVVHRFLHSDSVYGVFGTVLGLLAWIYLAVEVTVYCAEINVVLERRLWPRSIVQPPLTEADRTVMALQALQNQRRPEQQVEVSFTDRVPGARHGRRAPRTPEEVAPPARAEVPGQRDRPAGQEPADARPE